MSVAYRAVGWNPQKRLYDFVMGGLLLVALIVYAAAVYFFEPLTTPETFVIRFTAIAALVLLHAILVIGPLARLDARFLPLLYNRRHLGVTMFLLALVHAGFSVVQFHAGGDLNPLVSVLTSYRRDYANFVHFPFEALGLAALVIFFLMAATSHDFWLKNLGPSFWKLLHMLVYAAYGLVLAHVFLGALQSERSPVLPVLLGLGFAAVMGLHLAAFAKERALDRMREKAESEGFVMVATCEELQEGCGKVVVASGQRVALFLEQGRVFAMSNVCRHQGGPLGEGRILSGCVTCPWHGYQYRPEDGQSPPPFTEVVPTYAVRIVGGDIHVSLEPLPLGSKSDGASITGPASQRDDVDFFVGWRASWPRQTARYLRGVVSVLAAVVVIVFLAVARVQNPVDEGTFEFGTVKSFSGILYETPLPLLRSSDGGNFLLVGAGKFAPPKIIEGKHGRRVEFRGSLISRKGVSMIEMNEPGSLRVLDDSIAALPEEMALGAGAFTGELVDTKCYFGVMRPATGKVHRGCAIRCLSGGVPPGLLVRDGENNAVVLMLVGPEGGALDFDVQWAARTIAVTGELELQGGTPILRVTSMRLQP